MTETIRTALLELKIPQVSAFLEKADRLQHSREKLLGGEEIISFFKFLSLEEGGYAASNATTEDRAIRSKTFFHDSIIARAKLGQGVHDRGEAFVFAGVTPTEADRKSFSEHLPLHAKATSVLYKTVKKGETWDITIDPRFWGLNEMEEVYTILNVGTLILEKGARIVVRGNVFTMLCQQLICEDINDANDFHIGIWPTPFAVDFGHGPHDGGHGENGFSGIAGVDGQPVYAQQSILGPWIAEEQVIQTGATAGSDGTNGKEGNKGRNGGMCKLAEITIRSLQGGLHVFSQAGTGGNGGNGGAGGDGGDGGNGGNGAAGFNKIIANGNGGGGGAGGNGAKGGNAGHGGLASNIYIDIPVSYMRQLHLRSEPSIGGKAGAGGKKGLGGKGGDAGTTGIKVSAGKAGLNGADGSTGKNGAEGRGRPGANFYVNNIPYQHIS